ncbi:FAD-dependent monooxygenase [Streptomyces beihaiensis]|uniref:FAD-dependent monooxygenase n=1 Tax=Streptomyces beihaiensis TaxID=2984495 RepID=A0ABT3U1L0_9ACTN|nr:FAD-dependent monooxygenase [Streptomyces beihaiensis]MCX3062140.1 FAD-dependent monooxygenase [Streptomyces beihaiensis]
MDAQVIVVGAGPAGLMLAGELRLAGVEVVVLERLAEPTGESRGLGFTARTLEVFDQRGLLSRLGDIEITDLGHFGGLPVDFSLLGSAHSGGVKGVPQAVTEAMLEKWAVELGADLRRGHEVLSFADEGEYVEVEVGSPDGPRRLRAAYLVGCDGGRSTVRKAAGFDFPGTDSTMEMFLADVRGCDIAPRPIGETVPGGMVMAGPLDNGLVRIIVCERGTPPRRRTEPPSWEEVSSAWHRLTGQDISGGTPVWLSAFGNPARQVTQYRRGRVLLAGDAAHIHLPAGGQGMNTSVQDAVNLGWKLAATVKGTAPEGLLDTYHEERHPVGRRLLMNTQAQGLLFLSGAEMQPLRDVMSELIAFDNVSRHLAGMVSGLSIRYELGPGDHPLLGLRIPHVDLDGESGRTSTTELLHPARGVLLDLADNAALRSAAEPWSDRVDVVTATVHGPADQNPLASTGAVLVRPDGHVAWTAPGPVPPAEALARSFGAPGSR